MGLSPKLILLGLVAVIAIGVTGVVLAKTEAGGTSILGYCGTSIVVLLLMLQNTYQARESDRKTTQAAEVVRADVRKAEETVKTELLKSDKVQQKKLDAITDKVETVVQQTNGTLTNKLNSIENKVEEVKDKLPEPPASPFR